MDTLRTARSLEARVFTRDQAEGIAQAVASVGLTDLRRDLVVLKWMTGAVVVMAVAMFWQLLTINGAVTRINERLLSFGDRLDGIASRLVGVEARLTGVEARFATIGMGQATFGDRPEAVQTRPEPAP